VGDLEHYLVATAQPPLGDDRREQRPTDAAAAKPFADDQVADPSLERRVVQAASESEADEPGRLTFGNGQERRCIGIVDQRLETSAMRLRIIRGQRVELASQGKRVGEVISAKRPQLDPFRGWNGDATDRAVRVTECHPLSR
jgi:hypothetical protein